MVRGDCTGDVVFYGKGAGKLPTASAVCADIVDCCMHLKTRRFLFWADGDSSNIIRVNDSVFGMYLRLKGADAVSKAEAVFGKVKAIKDSRRGAVITDAMPLNEFNEKCEKLKADGVEILSTIRIGDL
jgi:homoserine dehydrogenase